MARSFLEGKLDRASRRAAGHDHSQCFEWCPLDELPSQRLMDLDDERVKDRSR